MTKEERIRAAVRGEAVDTIPYSLWTHLPGIDLDPVANAEKTYEFYKEYDIDLIKTMNNGMYSVEDFGCEVDYSEIARGGVAKITKTPVHTLEDWAKIQPVSIDGGALAREQKYLSLLLEKLKGEPVPVLFTVFSPITTANKLSGGKLLEYVAQGGGAEIHKALAAITETTCRMVERVVEMGAAGVFLASQMSTYDTMDETMYREYGAKYDVKVLEASKGWCNALHAHGSNIMFGVLKDYPVQVFNWHAWESLPEVGEAAELTGKCLMGGIERMDVTHKNRNALRNQIYHSIRETGGRHLILTPGCVIRYPLDKEMLSYVRKTKLEVEQALAGCGRLSLSDL